MLFFVVGLSTFLLETAKWFQGTWDRIDFATVVYQLSTPLKETSSEIITGFCRAVLPDTCIKTLVVTCALTGWTMAALLGATSGVPYKIYFRKHGNYEIQDYYWAIETGYIPAEYSTPWGFEDTYLFEIAKQELTMGACDGCH